MTIDQVISNFQRADLFITFQLQAAQRISGDLGMAGTHFAPVNNSISITIQLKHKIKIAQRNIPLARNLCAIHA